MSKLAPTFEAGHLPGDIHIAIVAARFNAHVVDHLLSDCVARLVEMGISESRLVIHRVPGAFELPVAAKWLAESGEFSAVVCLGCVIKGDTAHFDFVAGQASHGIQKVALDTGVPVIFGVLTTDTEAQAEARTNGHHSRSGRNAAEAAVEMILLSRKVHHVDL